jgi:hypothetical protein
MIGFRNESADRDITLLTKQTLCLITVQWMQIMPQLRICFTNKMFDTIPELLSACEGKFGWEGVQVIRNTSERSIVEIYVRRSAELTANSRRARQDPDRPFQRDLLEFIGRIIWESSEPLRERAKLVASLCFSRGHFLEEEFVGAFPFFFLEPGFLKRKSEPQWRLMSGLDEFTKKDVVAVHA